MRLFVLILAGLACALLGYMPFELRECARLEVEHGPKFFCIPISFIGIPILVTLLVLTAAIILWKRTQRPQ